MNISSVIVNVQSGQAPALRTCLQSIAGVEVHAATAQGKFVITIETETDGETADTFERINRLDGVLSIAMVYHQFESDPDKEA